MIHELVVISGKGGTGKTSIAAAFAALCGRSVIADCDVDAADLHLILSPRIIERREFRAGHLAVIRQEECVQCGNCLCCRFNAIRVDAGERGEEVYRIDPLFCEGCGLCVRLCPVEAIDFPEQKCGEWMISDTRYGPMVHAQLGIAAENSGKLVTLVRQEARRLAEERQIDWIIVDGPPGIGCPVIASVSGASSVLIVTEPTLSGQHDLERVLQLSKHFEIPSMVCVNKWDLNPEMTDRIESDAVRSKAEVVGRIGYDPGVTRMQIEARAAIEGDTPAAQEIRDIWNKVVSLLRNAHGDHRSAATLADTSHSSET